MLRKLLKKIKKPEYPPYPESWYYSQNTFYSYYFNVGGYGEFSFETVAHIGKYRYTFIGKEIPVNFLEYSGIRGIDITEPRELEVDDTLVLSLRKIKLTQRFIEG